MTDKKKSETSIIGVIVGCYFLMALLCFVAFTTLAGGPTSSSALAEGFLKALVWPYSVIEWNLEN